MMTIGYGFKPDYKITGKYLFFSPDKDDLIRIAKNEIEKQSRG